MVGGAIISSSPPVFICLYLMNVEEQNREARISRVAESFRQRGIDVSAEDIEETDNWRYLRSTAIFHMNKKGTLPTQYTYTIKTAMDRLNASDVENIK
jgi:hypothetical protein